MSPWSTNTPATSTRQRACGPRTFRERAYAQKNSSIPGKTETRNLSRSRNCTLTHTLTHSQSCQPRMNVRTAKTAPEKKPAMQRKRSSSNDTSLRERVGTMTRRREPAARVASSRAAISFNTSGGSTNAGCTHSSQTPLPRLVNHLLAQISCTTRSPPRQAQVSKVSGAALSLSRHIRQWCAAATSTSSKAHTELRLQVQQLLTKLRVVASRLSLRQARL